MKQKEPSLRMGASESTAERTGQIILGAIRFDYGYEIECVV